MKALLMLEDGTCAECQSFTGSGEVFGEMVFNTALTGYQEILTDPSYAGQIVLMTSSMIGNYDIRKGEEESPRIHPEGFVVKEYGGKSLASAEGVNRTGQLALSFNIPASQRTVLTRGRTEVICSLAEFLHSQDVLGVEGVDTRALTKHIRDRGAMKAGITTRTLDRTIFLNKVRASNPIDGQDLVGRVSTQEHYVCAMGSGVRIAVLDCGVKLNTLRELASRNCRVEVFPAYSSKGEILSSRPDGVLLSNGPGDPAELPSIVSMVEGLIGEVPIFGICLGHQIIGQALGAKTFKLKFGHHGGNHPVREERTEKVYVTTQNHNYAVDMGLLPSKEVKASFINLSDRTNEGLEHRDYPVFSTQFHPEAAPGPQDSLFLFDRFLHMVDKS